MVVGFFFSSRRGWAGRFRGRGGKDVEGLSCAPVVERWTTTFAPPEGRLEGSRPLVVTNGLAQKVERRGGRLGCTEGCRDVEARDEPGRASEGAESDTTPPLRVKASSAPMIGPGKVVVAESGWGRRIDRLRVARDSRRLRAPRTRSVLHTPTVVGRFTVPSSTVYDLRRGGRLRTRRECTSFGSVLTLRSRRAPPPSPFSFYLPVVRNSLFSFISC